MYIPTPLVSPGYGMYNTCDRAAPFGSRVKKRDRLGLYCLTVSHIGFGHDDAAFVSGCT